MAQFGVYRDAYFWLNGVDYSDEIESLSLDYKAELLDDTAMGDSTRSVTGGLKTWTVEGNVHQDFASGNLGANLFALVGATACFEMRPRNACTTVINPGFSGIGVIENAPQMGGAVGTLLDMAFTIRNAGTLTRSTTAT